jgi:beta-lactamase class A
MTGGVIEAADDIFANAGCTGSFLVRCLDDGRQVGLRENELQVIASTVKVLVGVAVETAFVEGTLDPTTPIGIQASTRVPGPVALSLFKDDAVVSLRDLTTLMLTLSDNTATDVLLDAVGLDAVNDLARRLGMSSSYLPTNVRGQVDSIGHDLGFAGMEELLAASASASAEENARLDQLLMTTAALSPETAIRSTASDMVSLLEQIWSDTAGHPEACARVRNLMSHQLTRQRLASGFGPGIRVAAKSGGLVGVVRNEIGVISYPDGTKYAAAVFTRSRPGSDSRAIDAAIGAVAHRAVKEL